MNPVHDSVRLLNWLRACFNYTSIMAEAPGPLNFYVWTKEFHVTYLPTAQVRPALEKSANLILGGFGVRPR